MTGRDYAVEVDVEIRNETDAAWLVRTAPGQDPVWVPKSLCEIDTAHLAQQSHVLTLPEWLANKKGLI